MPLDPSQPTFLFFAAVVLIGFFGGVIGGIAGLGGSVVMLPGLAFVLGYADESRAEHHVYMAACLFANVAVAIPATIRHKRAGVVSLKRAAALLPSILAGVVGGVLLSNKLDGLLLTRLLGGMIIVSLILVYVRERLAKEAQEPGPTPWLGFQVSGAATGMSAGLLGVGGGVVLVTALRGLAQTPIREAIAMSSTVMIVSAGVAAALKTSTLGTMGLSAWAAGMIALALAPGAVVGSMLGSGLVHVLPVHRVRQVVTVILFGAALKLLIG